MDFNNTRLGIIILVILSLITSLDAQIKNYDTNIAYLKEDVKVNIMVRLQDELIETDGVEFTSYCYTNKEEYTIILNNDFTVYLRSDSEYILTFTHKGFNKRSILINTTTPDTSRYVIDLTIRLYNNQPGGIMGSLFYDKTIDNFQSIGNVQNTTK